MLTYAHLQQQLAIDVQTRFTKKIFDCPSLAELLEPAKAFITEVASLALPEIQIVFRPKEMPPQEEAVELEESKDQPKFDLVAHAAKETLGYLNYLAIVGVSMAADIQNLQTQKKDAEKLMASLGKHKGPEDLTKQLIIGLSSEINLLTKKIASNERKPEEIGAKITTLFSAAKEELQQIQETSTQPDLTLKTRLTAHVRPGKVIGVQDHQHPSEKELDFQNQIVGVLFDRSYGQFNVMMSNGNHGRIEYSNRQEIKMKKSEPVAKISVFQGDSQEFIRGFRFHSKSGEVLLEVGECKVSPVEFVLAEGERVIGLKSRIQGKGTDGAYHCDLQFIIGRMEA